MVPLYVVILVTSMGMVMQGTGAVGPREGNALRPVQSIDSPNVEGRIDHGAVDLRGDRPFVAGQGNPVKAVEPAAGPAGAEHRPDRK